MHNMTERFQVDYPVCGVVSQARVDMSADNVRGVEVFLVPQFWHIQLSRSITTLLRPEGKYFSTKKRVAYVAFRVEARRSKG
jgi:hypothetical protein